MDYKKISYAVVPFLKSSITDFLDKNDRKDEIVNLILEEYSIIQYNLYTLIEVLLGIKLTTLTEPDYEDIKNCLDREKIKRRQIKKNWVQLLKEELPGKSKMKPRNPKSLTNETNNYFSLIKSNPHILDEAEKYSSKVDYMNKRYLEIKSWASKSETLLTDYCYLEQKTLKVQMNSFISDIVYDSLNIILSNFNGNLNGYITVFPKNYLEYPVFGYSKAKLPIELLVIQNELHVISSEYKTGDYVIRTELTPNQNSTDLTLQNNNYRELDSTDREAFTVIYNLFYNRNISDNSKLDISLKQLTKLTFNSLVRIRKEHLDKMEDILHKLSTYNVTVYVTSKGNSDDLYERLSLNMLQQVSTYYPSPSKKEKMVEIVPSNALTDAILNEKHVMVLSDIYNLVETTHGRTWLIILQNERIRCFNKIYEKPLLQDNNYEISETVNNMSVTLPFAYFKSKVKMRMVPAQIKQAVLTNVNLLLDKGIIIKDYKHSDTDITIHFTELTEQEEILYGLKKGS